MGAIWATPSLLWESINLHSYGVGGCLGEFMNIGRSDYLGGTALIVVRSVSRMEFLLSHMGVHSTSLCHGRTEPPVQRMMFLVEPCSSDWHLLACPALRCWLLVGRIRAAWARHHRIGFCVLARGSRVWLDFQYLVGHDFCRRDSGVTYHLSGPSPE